MDWFEALTGFPEQSPQQVHRNIAIDGTALTSQVNGKTFTCGHLETPSLAELRKRVQASGPQPGELSLREVRGNIQKFHTDPANANALFQVASQFNLLEMVSPNVTPEQGIGIYDNDPTQGPACAIAAGAGTIYRNYFAPVNGQMGQSANNQVDCLADLGAALGNTDGHLWRMQNGYVLPTSNGLAEISSHLQILDETERDELRQQLRIGIQWDTEVTLDNVQHFVSQAYCSALPVAYTAYSRSLWASFAKLILEASYEATICSAILNAKKTGNNQVFLTLLGGGAFGNETDWIMKAIYRALSLYRNIDLDVAIVSYGTSNPHVQDLMKQFEDINVATATPMNSIASGCYDLFYRDTSYFRLLHLGGAVDKAHKSVIELSKLPLQKSWTEDTLRLLATDNWRYHIAALISYLTLQERSTAIEQELWSCISRGSWISPQIVAGLYFKGADVVTNTVEILRNGIHSSVIDPIVAHVEIGPGSNTSRQGKLLNSIIGLGLREQLMMSDLEINQIVSSDIDRADRISAMWHHNLIQILDNTPGLGSIIRQ